MTERYKDYLKIFSLALVVLVAYYARTLVLITIIGIGVGVIFNPTLELIKAKLNLPKGYAALIILILLSTLILVVTSAFGYIVFEQAQELGEKLPDLNKQFHVKLKSYIESITGFSDFININFKSFIEGLVQFFIKSAQLGTEAISGFVFALVLGTYLAIDSEQYFKKFLCLFSKEHRLEVKDSLIDIAAVIRKWFNAQLLTMFIVGLFTAIGLWGIGVRYWAIFGLLTCLFSVIPYIGILTIILVVCFVTLATDPTNLTWVLLLFLVTQLIEGNFLLPKIMKDKVKIPEALLLVVMLFFGYWFGLLGLLVAPGLTAASIKVFEKRLA